MTLRILLTFALLFWVNLPLAPAAEEEPVLEPPDLLEPQAFDPNNPPLDLEKEKRILTWDEEEQLRAAAEEESRIHGLKPDEQARFLESLTNKEPLSERKPKKDQPK